MHTAIKFLVSAFVAVVAVVAALDEEPQVAEPPNRMENEDDQNGDSSTDESAASENHDDYENGDSSMAESDMFDNGEGKSTASSGANNNSDNKGLRGPVYIDDYYDTREDKDPYLMFDTHDHYEAEQKFDHRVRNRRNSKRAKKTSNPKMSRHRRRASLFRDG